MKKLILGDNLKTLNDCQKKGLSFDIVYLDPPYNTGNKFGYGDNVEKKIWYKNIDERVVASKKIMGKDSVLLFSISEESLFESLEILKKNFKYVFEPLVWLTKSALNQNKMTNISSVCHEYVLVASDYKIKTLPESLSDAVSEKKLKNYPLRIKLKKKLDNYDSFVNNGKTIFRIRKGEFEIEKEGDSFLGHFFQKRTAQKGHGAQRYVKMTLSDKKYDSETLYFISGVKDKQGLGGKFIMGNSYFQSVTSEMKMKMPSFLGSYQPGVKGFQTAKPIELMERLFRNFANGKKANVLDVYSGSGNALIAANNLGFDFIGCELGLDKEQDSEKGDFLKKRLVENNVKF